MIIEKSLDCHFSLEQINSRILIIANDFYLNDINFEIRQKKLRNLEIGFYFP
jgi:hypothetical protein